MPARQMRVSTRVLPSATKKLRYARIGVVLAVLALLITAHQLGILAHFSDPPRLKAALIDLGAWGYAAFIVAYAFLQPFGIPGTVYVVAAALIWPWPIAFALSMTGTMCASVTGFSFARFVARDTVSRLIPERFRKYDEALERRAFATVVALRFVFWMPPLLHAFFGISKVPFWTHFWGSLVGYVVPLLAMSYFGQVLFDAARDAPARVWVGAVGILLLLGLLFWVLRRRRVGETKAV
jgi:uncharacterized membrane protein YdjX (TVP38/TMEM64 family)